jgi:hypothetical protein
MTRYIKKFVVPRTTIYFGGAKGLSVPLQILKEYRVPMGERYVDLDRWLRGFERRWKNIGCETKIEETESDVIAKAECPFGWARVVISKSEIEERPAKKVEEVI